MIVGDAHSCTPEIIKKLNDLTNYGIDYDPIEIQDYDETKQKSFRY